MTNMCATACGQPSETELCGACWTLLERELGDVKWLCEQLDVTFTRQAKITSGGIGFVTGNPETALPLHLGASDTFEQLRDLLSSWVRDLWEHHAVRWTVCQVCAAECRDGKQEHRLPTCPGTWDTHVDPLDIAMHPVPLSRWIIRHPSWVQSHRAAFELWDELTAVIRRARRVVFGPQERVYLGPCMAASLAQPDEPESEEEVLCPEDLYGIPDRATVVCPTCGMEWSMADRRQWLLHEVEDQLQTATEMSRALPTYLDQPLTAAMVRGYAARGRILPHGYRQRGQQSDPTYRVGDVIDLLNQIRAESARTQEAS
ncbi:hypothetical protein [Amycolatopsis sp. NPDC059657]|uniref:hypothetical protein n=1 Tax=Amycolatopsis sp. NPDC059657 TaxID=3346899 RepID=UPI003670F2E4